MYKTIYALNGYIPSDEDIVVIDIYKFIKFNKECVPHYGWIKVNCSEEGGIGTLATNFGITDRDKALLDIHNFCHHPNFLIMKETFDEMLIAYKDMKVTLEFELKK